MKREALLIVLLAGAASAQDAGTPAAAKPAKAPAVKPLWREHAPKPIPEFNAPGSWAPLVKAVRATVVNLSMANGSSSKSLGSGFLINADGYVVTNNHVVDKAQAIRARLGDGRELDAITVGKDPTTDLALLKLTGEGVGSLPFAYLGDSDQLEVGDWVLAIGNPFGLETSVTQGIVSARERVLGLGDFDDFIQTNALVNPGNSGGPLFNVRGEVVGVTSSILNQGQGIGFAAPINLVKELLPNLLHNGKLERGWLGLNVRDQDEHHHAVVVDVYKGSPAEKAGVKPGDVVEMVDGKPVDSYLGLLRRIGLLAPGVTVKLKILRDTKSYDFSATLQTRPAAEVTGTAPASRIEGIGVLLRELPPAVAQKLALPGGLLVEGVMPGSAAELGGVLEGDVVVEVNREPATLSALQEAMKEVPAQTILLKLQRNDRARYVALKPH